MAVFFDPSNSIAGTSSSDIIFAGAGDNTVSAGAGNDAVFAGDGNDSVAGGSGNDLIFGGGGDDLLSGGDDIDIILGGAGNDTIGGDAGDDILSGGTGADAFIYKANFGNDLITDFTFGEDKINIFANTFGNTKNISLSSVADFQKLLADYPGVATITDVGHGAIKLTLGSAGSITLMNLSDSFFAVSNSGNSAGSSGDNLIIGGDDPSHLTGGGGNDTILGGSGNSVMEGNDQNDILVGGQGVDLIGGQGGNDALFGGGGNDTVNGGTGDDTLTGGDGADAFQFKAGFGHDTVLDLNFSEGDVLSFVGADGEGTTQVHDLTELNALIASTGAVVTHTNDVTFINFTDGNELTLMGYALGTPV